MGGVAAARRRILRKSVRDRLDGVEPLDLTPYIEGWRRRGVEREARARAREAMIRARLGVVVSILVERFGARRVILFGSLAEGTSTPLSDVDLAVEGLRGDWFEAWEAAERALGPGLRLDLLPVDRARPALRRAIERGEVLFGDR